MFLKNPVVPTEYFNLDHAEQIKIKTGKEKSIKIILRSGAKTITEKACSDDPKIAKKQYADTLKKVQAYLKSNTV